MWQHTQDRVIDLAHDMLGNFYIATESEIVKMDKTGDTVAIYHAPKRKKISYFDASNPMQLLVFFDETDQLAWLDKSMNETYTLSAMQLNLYAFAATCRSRDDGLWVYDNLQQWLVKANFEQRQLVQKSELGLLLDAPFNFIKMSEYDGIIYAYDPSKGMFVFDAFGQLKKRIPIPACTDWSVANGMITYCTHEGWYSYNPTTFETDFWVV
jgi:hypothetical protein